MKSFAEIQKSFRYPSVRIQKLDALSERLDDADLAEDTEAELCEIGLAPTIQSAREVFSMTDIEVPDLECDVGDIESVFDAFIVFGEIFLEELDGAGLVDDEIEAMLIEAHARCFEAFVQNPRVQELVPDACAEIKEYLATAMLRYPSAQKEKNELDGLWVKLIDFQSEAMSECCSSAETVAEAEIHAKLTNNLINLGVDAGAFLKKHKPDEYRCYFLDWVLTDARAHQEVPEWCAKATKYLEKARQLPEEHS